MKAEELMIGDWIILGNTHPMRVTKLSQYGEYNDYTPIPITKEILQKNGFDCSDKEIARLDFIDGDYNGHFSLRAMYEKGTGAQRGWGFYAFNVLVVLDYVHELQHAMRLCGIKQEIKL